MAEVLLGDKICFMESFLRYYLPIFLLAYLGLAFVLPSIKVYRQTGIHPVTFGKGDNAHDFIGLIMKALTAVLAFTVASYSFGGQLYDYLVPIPYLETPAVKYMGLLLMHGALVWIILAQSQMRASWRIGIDEKNRTDLVTTGLFSISRNPIFLGMIISTLALFLIIPNVLSFFTVACSYIIIQIQIRLEEEFLLSEHGGDYTEYKERTSRLI